MPAAQFVVPLADLEHGPKRVTWQVPVTWLRSALDGTGAEPRADGVLDLELTRDGREVLVRGSAQVALTMTCVRSLEPMDVDLSPEIFLLLEQLPEANAHTRRQQQGRQQQGRQQQGRQQQGRQPQPHQPNGRQAKGGRDAGSELGGVSWADSPVLGNEDAARDVFRGERVELDDFVREFIVLDLPMAPVRSDLHSGPEAASPAPSAGHRSLGDMDPRLAPLAAIAKRMRQKEHKE